MIDVILRKGPFQTLNFTSTELNEHVKFDVLNGPYRELNYVCMAKN